MQQNVLHDTNWNWAGAVRLSFVTMYGPDDVDFSVYGTELVTSRKYALFSQRVAVAPYAVVAASLSRSHEKTSAVALGDESVWGAQTMVGVVARYSTLRVAVEYGVVMVQSLSFKVGFGRGGD